MTVVVPGVGVITRKPKWKQLLFPVEIPAARFSCLTSGSFRPKLGICILLSIFLAFILLVVVPCAIQYYSPFIHISPHISLRRSSPEEMAEITKNTVDSLDKMTADLLEHLKDGNLVMSTFSLGTVMGMLLAGAKGDTKAQLLEFMRQKSIEDAAEGFKKSLDTIREQQNSRNFTLRAANRVYTESAFNPTSDYADLMKAYYEAPPTKLNFATDSEGSRKAINDWVEDQTDKKIQDLLAAGTVDSLTRMVLVNALYFKGDWASKFDAKHTQEDVFYVDSKTTVKVPMMYQKSKFQMLRIEELGGAVALQMPYKGQSLDMVFMLPAEGNGLSEFELKLKDVNLNQLLSRFSEGRSGNVIVKIPKFKVESTLDLKEPLMKLGVENAFVEGKADLSGISGSNDLFVSLIVQKAFIEVNEEGAEAAAATAAVMQYRMAVRDPRFECNRPFYFAIRDRASGLILFSGRVVNPLN